jgi:hypothetical protein
MFIGLINFVLAMLLATTAMMVSQCTSSSYEDPPPPRQNWEFSTSRDTPAEPLQQGRVFQSPPMEVQSPLSPMVVQPPIVIQPQPSPHDGGYYEVPNLPPQKPPAYRGTTPPTTSTFKCNPNLECFNCNLKAPKCIPKQNPRDACACSK